MTPEINQTLMICGAKISPRNIINPFPHQGRLKRFHNKAGEAIALKFDEPRVFFCFFFGVLVFKLEKHLSRIESVKNNQLNTEK